MKKLDFALVALAISTLSFASCSGADNSFAPTGMPAAPQQVEQSQPVNGAPPDQSAPIQTVPQEETGPQQDPGSLGAPVSSEPVPDGAASPSVQAPETPPRARHAAAQNAGTAPSHCSNETIPGTYTAIFAEGRVNDGTFTALTGSGTSLWERSFYVSAKHAPAPKTSPSTAQPLYVYTGTYTVTNGKSKVDTVGCVTLLATQSGTAIRASKFNAQSSGTPTFTKPARGTVVASGTITKLTIAGLSKSGGTGTFLLSNKFTGTIRLTSRTTVP